MKENLNILKMKSNNFSMILNLDGLLPTSKKNIKKIMENIKECDRSIENIEQLKEYISHRVDVLYNHLIGNYGSIKAHDRRCTEYDKMKKNLEYVIFYEKKKAL